MTNRAPRVNAVPCKFVLHIQHIPHRICCLFLCGCCHMSIGIQREPSGEVAQHAGYRLDIYTVLQGYRSEGVAEVVESDFWDAGSGQYTLEHIVHTVR